MYLRSGRRFYSTKLGAFISNLTLCEILKFSKTIAVLGISSNPNKYGRFIAEYLFDAGYEIVGINPNLDSAGRIKVYPSLNDIPFVPDIINVFRRSEYIPEIIPDVLKRGTKTLWLQSGIRNDEAIKPVAEAGIQVIQDTCIMVTHKMCV